jgi:hypothetical protein
LRSHIQAISFGLERPALPGEGPELSGAPPLDGTLSLLRQSAATVVVASIFTVVCWWAFWLV